MEESKLISVVCILTRLGAVPSEARAFAFFTQVSRPVLGLTQLPSRWITGAVFLDVKRPGREADH
jgi:hypothetical protein